MVQQRVPGVVDPLEGVLLVVAHSHLEEPAQRMVNQHFFPKYLGTIYHGLMLWLPRMCPIEASVIVLT